MSREPTRKAYKMSLVLHGSVLAALLLYAGWQGIAAASEPPPERIFQLYDPVEGAPLQAGLRARSQTPRDDIKPIAVKLPPAPAPAPAAQAAPKPQPAAAKPAPKPSAKPIDYSSFLKENKLPKQAASRNPAPAPARASNGVTGAPTVRIDAAAITRDLQQNLSGDDNVRVSQMSSAEKNELYGYFQHVKALLDANFERPVGVNQALRTTIEFKVEGDGRIGSTRVLRSSGNAALDQAALDAFKRTGRVPAPPGRVGYTRTVNFSMGTD